MPDKPSAALTRQVLALLVLAAAGSCAAERRAGPDATNEKPAPSDGRASVVLLTPGEAGAQLGTDAGRLAAGDRDRRPRTHSRPSR